jgi:hypothetical protein
MNWEVIATVADVVGALGVIASLVFVGFQIRRNSEATRAATTMQTLDQSAAVSQFLAQDRSIADLYFRGLKNPDALGKDQKSQFFMMLLSAFRRYENTAYQYEKRFLEDEAWEGLKGNMQSIVHRPGFDWFWQRAKPGFSSRFATVIEELRSGSVSAPS